MGLLQHQWMETNMAIVFPADKKLRKGLYQRLSAVPTSASFKFFFILPGEGFERKDSIVELGRFFFLPHYCFQEENSPLLVFKERAREETIELFGQWCSSQRLGKPYLLEAKNSGVDHREPGALTYISREQRESYFGVLKSRPGVLHWTPQPIVIEASDGEDSGHVNEKLHALIGFVEKEYPDIYALLQTVGRLEEESKREKAVLKFLQQEVNNFKVYNKELQAGNETENILNFYHTQYEVLPLWYKRFGHVIKILMGKRKLSLATNKEER